MAEIKFLILTTQRSGSTLLRTALDSHPEICCYGEIFLEKYTGPGSFFRMAKSTDSLGLLSVLRRRQMVARLLDGLYQEDCGKAVGFKFMYDQARYRPYKFPMVMKYAELNHVKVIHLHRQNILSTCLSRQFARMTRTYHAERDIEQVPIYIDIPRLFKDMREIEKERRKWKSRLERLRYLDVYYEAFVADRKAVSTEILDFLDVDTGFELVSRLKKVRTAPLDVSIKNYADVESAVRDAGYGRFLSLDDQ